MEPTSNEIKQKISNTKDAVSEKMHKMDHHAFQDGYHAVESSVREGMKEVRASLKEGRDISEEFVKTHPFYSILGAAAVGFIAGSLISKRN